MALTNGNNFVFIHIYKCGGTSLRSLLSSGIATQEVNKGHSTAKEMRDYYYYNGGGFLWETSYKFSFVRNPFDLTVSLYEYIKGNPNHANYNEVKDLDFHDFCKWNVEAIKNKKQNPNGKFHTLSEFLFDDTWKLLVDFVGKIENINEDMRTVCDRLKIPFDGKVPHINTSNREPDYRKYYNDESKDIITNAFYYDLVNFNYSF